MSLNIKDIKLILGTKCVSQVFDIEFEPMGDQNIYLTNLVSVWVNTYTTDVDEDMMIPSRLVKVVRLHK